MAHGSCHVRGLFTLLVLSLQMVDDEVPTKGLRYLIWRHLLYLERACFRGTGIHLRRIHLPFWGVPANVAEVLPRISESYWNMNGA